MTIWRRPYLMLSMGLLSAVLCFVVTLSLLKRHTRTMPASLRLPVRAEPASFPPDTHLPPSRERDASGPVDPRTFSARKDLVRIVDTRVWWESDQPGVRNGGDDHLVHKSAEIPLRRLIEIVVQHDATLRVHDAYRQNGEKHVQGSLHGEGRAVDLTCDKLPLEKLAKLCWAAGFDWVYHEATAKGGAHVHASVAR